MEDTKTASTRNADAYVVTSIRLDKESKAWLEDRAAENDRTMSAELRCLVREARKED